MLRDENQRMTIPPYALSVMETLEAAGEEVYVVGGCVRDALLGKTPNDYDMAVSCPPERTLELLSDYRTIATGLAHGTVTAISDGNPIEITTFRVDGSYTDSRRPDSVDFTRSLSEDLARRDFTVNAMAYSRRGELVDLFGGREDLARGLIRAVGEPERRFTEDALRIMRAFRFSAQLGFDIDSDTLSAAAVCRDGLSRIARERIREEFIRLLFSPEPRQALELMVGLGIMSYITDSYLPDNNVIGLLSQMPRNDIARLGMLLCNADRAVADAVLRELRCSNKQRSGALAIVRECRTSVTDRASATALRSRAGEHAAYAVRASVLLGVNQPEAEELVCNDRAPISVSELAIGGRELCELGFRGVAVGETLGWLLERVMHDPSLNERETLLALARKKRKKNEE